MANYTHISTSGSASINALGGGSVDNLILDGVVGDWAFNVIGSALIITHKTNFSSVLTIHNQFNNTTDSAIEFIYFGGDTSGPSYVPVSNSDTVTYGSGGSVINGAHIVSTDGTSSNTLDYSDLTGPGVYLNLYLNQRSDSAGTVIATLSSTIENVIGSDFNDQISGDYFNNAIFAGAGDDIINANEGDDIVYGGDGNDTINGGDGVRHPSSLLEGTGADKLYGEAGDDLLIGGEGDDLIDGGSGTDTVSYSVATSGVVVNLLNASWQYDGVNTIDSSTGFDGTDGVDTLIDVENITGSGFNDYLRGSNSFASVILAGDGDDYIIGQALGDTIEGGRGNDFISASGGDDLVNGGEGEDSLHGGNDNDTLHGGDDNDLIFGGNGHDSLYGDDGADTLTGGAGDDTLYGGDGDDIINANDGADILYGENGDDIMRGYTGDDMLYGGAGDDLIFGGKNIYDTFDSNDTLYGDEGNDILYGLGGDDVLYGGIGNDNLYGYAGDDVLRGEDGIDLLRGGDGNDTLYSEGDRDRLFGEGGADVFVFEGASAFDDITFLEDFNVSEGDSIDLSQVLNGFTHGTDDINDFLSLGEAEGHTYLWADSNGAVGGGNVEMIARIKNVTGLDIDTLFTNNDIIV